MHNILNELVHFSSFLITISSSVASSSSSSLVFRAGEQGRFWYAVLGGSLEVRYHAHSDADGKVSALTSILHACSTNRDIHINIYTHTIHIFV